MIVIGTGILIMNQRFVGKRKSFTTITGKSSKQFPGKSQKIQETPVSIPHCLHSGRHDPAPRHLRHRCRKGPRPGHDRSPSARGKETARYRGLHFRELSDHLRRRKLAFPQPGILGSPGCSRRYTTRNWRLRFANFFLPNGCRASFPRLFRCQFWHILYPRSYH